MQGCAPLDRTFWSGRSLTKMFGQEARRACPKPYTTCSVTENTKAATKNTRQQKTPRWQQYTPQTRQPKTPSNKKHQKGNRKHPARENTIMATENTQPRKKKTKVARLLTTLFGKLRATNSQLQDSIASEKRLSRAQHMLPARIF